MYVLSYSWYLGRTGSDPGLFPQDSTPGGGGWGGGWGTPHLKGVGMLVGNFELNP